MIYKNILKSCKARGGDTSKVDDKIIEYLKRNPYLSAKEIAKELDIDRAYVYLRLYILEYKGIVSRAVGSNREYKWFVVGDDSEEDNRR